LQGCYQNACRQVIDLLNPDIPEPNSAAGETAIAADTDGDGKGPLIRPSFPIKLKALPGVVAAAALR
jgi:hypothetical protein